MATSAKSCTKVMKKPFAVMTPCRAEYKYVQRCSRMRTPSSTGLPEEEKWLQLTWSMEQKMWASSCWKRRTRVRPVRAPDSSLRCRTPKSAMRSGNSLQERGR